jgi:hypothetical protein
VWSFSLRLFVRFLTAVRAFRYGSSCVSLRPFLPTGLALHLGAPLANSPCLALGRPTLARLLVCFVTALRAFGCPRCEVALRCVWVPILRTHLALRCVRVPNLGEVVLKNLPPSQNWFLSVLRLVFLPSAPLCGRFRYGSSCVSLRPFVRFVTALRAFGRPSCRLVLHFVWVPLLPTRLALPLVAQPWPVSSCVLLRLFVRLGAHVAKSPCVALGHPSCELALRCVRAPNLGEAVLKNLPPSQNWFLSVIPLVFLPSAPFCGRFRYGSSCVSLRTFVRFVAALRASRGGSSCVSLRLFVRLGAHLANWPCIAFGCPSFQLPLPCPWSGSSCVSLRLFVRLGAHLANSPCVAFGRPTLVRPY